MEGWSDGAMEGWSDGAMEGQFFDTLRTWRFAGRL